MEQDFREEWCMQHFFVPLFAGVFPLASFLQSFFIKGKASYLGIATVEVLPTASHYCSRCGGKSERFSFEGGEQVRCRRGKFFFCPHCGYLVNADFNASMNVHHSFYQEVHWQPKE